MTRILLITDTERVERVFHAVAAQGALHLHTVATLTDGDAEIAAFAPDLVFIQSRISGFSSAIALRHLSKSFPQRSAIMLLTVDAEDAAQARKQGFASLDLAVEDELLEEALKKSLAEALVPTPVEEGKPAPARKKGKGKATEAPPLLPAEAPGLPAEGPAPPLAPKPAAKRRTVSAKKRQAAEQEVEPSTPPAPPAEVPAAAGAVKTRKAGSLKARLAQSRQAAEEATAPAGEAEKREEPPAPEPVPGLPEPQVATIGELPVSAPPEESAGEAPVGAPPFGTGKTVAASFADLMQRYSAAEPPQARPQEAGPQKVEDRISLGSFSRPPGPAETPSGAEEGAWAGRGSELIEGEPLAEAMRRAQRKKRPSWVVPLALAMIFIPLVYYVVVKPASTPAPVPSKAATPSRLPTPAPTAAPTPVPPPSLPKVGAPTTPTTISAARPVLQSAAKPAAAPAAKQPVTPAPALAPPAVKPAPAPGVKALPQFLAGTKADAAYGKAHPGWQRFIGARAEYKLFKEAERYKAIQVIALSGQSISDQIYRDVLLGFGGINSYQLQSSQEKGAYVIEQGVAQGGVNLTIYRNKKDLSIKGLVLYYR